MSRKEARSVVVMMDLDQNLFPLTASFGLLSVSIDNIYYVIQYRCWCRDQWLSLSSQGRRGWIIHDSHVGCACNDCNGSTICIYPEQKLQPVLLFWGYIFKKGSHASEGSHASTMAQFTEDTDKYMLVRIPPSGREPPDVGLTRIR